MGWKGGWGDLEDQKLEFQSLNLTVYGLSGEVILARQAASPRQAVS